MVQCYQHTRQRQFRPMECVATRTMRFSHLSSLAFLCIIPQSSVRRSSSGRFVELQGTFCDIFHALLSEREAIITAVRGLMRPSRKRRLETQVIEDAEVED
jgi:hypothetical protein